MEILLLCSYKLVICHLLRFIPSFFFFHRSSSPPRQWWDTRCILNTSVPMYLIRYSTIFLCIVEWKWFSYDKNVLSIKLMMLLLMDFSIKSGSQFNYEVNVQLSSLTRCGVRYWRCVCVCVQYYIGQTKWKRW